MIVALLENAALLTLAGVGVYIILTHAQFGERPFVRTALVGVVLGMAGFMVTINPVIAPSGATLDARAGPTLLAAFLGGPVGAVFAAVAGGAARTIVGGSFAMSGVIVFVVYAALGLALRYVSKRAIDCRLGWTDLIMLSVAGLIGAALMYFVITPREMANAWLASTYPYIAFANVVSTVCLGGIVQFALKHADDARAAREVSERLALATRAGGIGVWEYDMVSQVAVWDDRMHDIYETSPDNYHHRFQDWLATVHEDDRPDSERKLVSMDQALVARGGEFRIRMPDGRLKSIYSDMTAVNGPDGLPSRLIGVDMDVTDLRTSESREQAARRQFSAVAENVPGVVFQLRIEPDGSERFTYLSPRFGELCNTPVESVSSDPSLFWGCAVEARTRIQSTLAVSAAMLKPWKHRWQITTTGADKWVEARALPERTGTGGTIWNGIFFDITQDVVEEAEVAHVLERDHQSQKLEAIGKLTGGVAHDFNNLLAVIVGNVEFLRDELDDKDHQNLANAALDASARGAELVRKMLSFARQARLAPEVFDLNHKIETLEEWIGRVLPARISLERRLDSDLNAIEADVSSVETALLNLILNARDAMPDGGKLTLATRMMDISSGVTTEDGADLPDGRYAVISVADTGEGIDAIHLNRVFEPFFTTKEKGSSSGSGLGLAMVHGFMKQSKGAVRVVSKPGEGTTVSLFFPALDHQLDSDSTEVGLAERGTVVAPIRILVAEDEPGVAKVLKRMLIQAGHDVTTSVDGDSAARAFEHDGPFDLLLTDIVMPGALQGPDLARKLREKSPKLPVIFISGYARDAVVSSHTMSASDIRLTKPILRAELEKALSVAIRRPRAPQATVVQPLSRHG